jgi:hypothetical protein
MMRETSPTATYSIAWFKLAECVLRGEKERALALFRLLTHTLDDVALALQLEGDILTAFHDSKAVEKYEQAALWYKKSNKLQQAMALWQMLHQCAPYKIEYMQELIAVYVQLNLKDNINEIMYKLVTLLHERDSIKLLNQYIQQLADTVGWKATDILLRSAVHSLKMHNELASSVVEYIEETIGLLLSYAQRDSVKAFIMQLEELDADLALVGKRCAQLPAL